MPIDELDVLRRLVESQSVPPPGETHIGDDGAVLRIGGTNVVVTTDAVVDGVHVDQRWCSAADIGWKSVAVNVSDLAAMGAYPTAVVIAIAAPEGVDVEALLDGCREAALSLGVAIVGGDLSSSATLVVTVTALGTAESPVLRRGASVGDDIWVSGPLGGSAAGLRVLQSDETSENVLTRRHRRPVARIDLGERLAALGATAMLDISDGLFLDVDRMASASGVGVRLDAVPAVDGATLTEATTGGEDYELLFTLRPDATARAAASGLGCIAIGTCVNDPAVREFRGEPFEPAGWSHRF